MRTIAINALTLAFYFSLNAVATAEAGLPKDKYDALGKQIDSDYTAEKAVCDSLATNLKDICETAANGKMRVAMAELEYHYKPSAETFYNARIVKADADYSLAAQNCDGKDGNAEDVCEKEATAAKIQQTAAAEVQLKTTKADAIAIEKSSDARNDAEKDMREANYAVAKEKCEALAGDSEDLCKKNAKIHSGL